MDQLSVGQCLSFVERAALAAGTDHQNFWVQLERTMRVHYVSEDQYTRVLETAAMEAAPELRRLRLDQEWSDKKEKDYKHMLEVYAFQVRHKLDRIEHPEPLEARNKVLKDEKKVLEDEKKVLEDHNKILKEEKKVLEDRIKVLEDLQDLGDARWNADFIPN